MWIFFYRSRDSQLIGAQVDQEVLKEMLSEKLPKLSAHFNSHGVDPTLFSLNWFLCIFVDTIPVKTYLHIWDAFLFEGTKVSFYFSQKYWNNQAPTRKCTVAVGYVWPMTPNR